MRSTVSRSAARSPARCSEWFRVGGGARRRLRDARRGGGRRPRRRGGRCGCCPYLQGERTPVWDAGARGAFVGLTLAHGRGHLYRAVLEGVAVSFRHCAEIAAEGGNRAPRGHRGRTGARAARCGGRSCATRSACRSHYVRDGAAPPRAARMLAGMAVGVLDGRGGGAALARRRLVRHVPDAARAATYAALLDERREL